MVLPSPQSAVQTPMLDEARRRGAESKDGVEEDLAGNACYSIHTVWHGLALLCIDWWIVLLCLGFHWTILTAHQLCLILLWMERKPLFMDGFIQLAFLCF